VGRHHRPLTDLLPSLAHHHGCELSTPRYAGHGGPAPHHNGKHKYLRGCWPIFDRSKPRAKTHKAVFIRRSILFVLQHVRDPVDALEVDQSAGSVFGHRDAAEADDFLARTVDRDGRQDHRARLLDMTGEPDRGEGEQGHAHAPPARPRAWGGHGFDAHQEGQDNRRNPTPSQSETRLHRMVRSWCRGAGHHPGLSPESFGFHPESMGTYVRCRPTHQS